MQLQDQVVVITGAASGIGLALATRFIQEGATVITSDLRADFGEPQAQRIGARFVSANVGREADIQALVHNVLGHEGRIDLFVSNAGIAMAMDAFAPEAEWDRILDINLKSHIWAARHVLPHMLERGMGYLLNTASAAGLLNEIDSVGYGVTKHAAVGFAEWLAFTYADRGIRVSVLCPEGVATPMIEASPYLQARAVTPESVAQAVVEALHEERFMITTHPTTLPHFQQKAGNYDGYVKLMTTRRAQALAMHQVAPLPQE